MKHTFNRLARGVKLQVGHIYTAVTSSLDNLTDKAGTSDGVVVNQMAAPDGPFTVHHRSRDLLRVHCARSRFPIHGMAVHRSPRSRDIRSPFTAFPDT